MRECSSLIFVSSLQIVFPQYNLISFKVESLSSVASPLQFNSTTNFVAKSPGTNKTGLHLPNIKRRLLSGSKISFLLFSLRNSIAEYLETKQSFIISFLCS